MTVMEKSATLNLRVNPNIAKRNKLEISTYGG
jgi:hypothetical protein